MTTTTRRIVGTLAVPAGVIHDASYETAAWYRTFEYPAQTVEVTINGEFAGWTLEGRTTYEYFPSLFGGVATGGGTIGECDKPSQYHVRPYNYTAAAMVEANEIMLNDSARLDVSYFDHPISCMGYVTNYGAPIGQRYSPCEHEHHVDAHGAIVTTRNDRGHLPFGYTGQTNRKRHIRITMKETS